MQARPLVTIRTVSDSLGISFPTAGAFFAYSDYLALLDRGTDLLPIQ